MCLVPNITRTPAPELSPLGKDAISTVAYNIRNPYLLQRAKTPNRKRGVEAARIKRPLSITPAGARPPLALTPKPLKAVT